MQATPQCSEDAKVKSGQLWRRTKQGKTSILALNSNSGSSGAKHASVWLGDFRGTEEELISHG